MIMGGEMDDFEPSADEIINVPTLFSEDAAAALLAGAPGTHGTAVGYRWRLKIKSGARPLR